MRTAIACLAAFALLGMASGLALLYCPFLVSSDHDCCHKYSPKKCPLSETFETCPYVPLDAKLDVKIDHADAKILAVPFPGAGLGELMLIPRSIEPAFVTWTPSLTDLHIRIRVLLV